MHEDMRISSVRPEMDFSDLVDMTMRLMDSPAFASQLDVMHFSEHEGPSGLISKAGRNKASFFLI